MGLDYHKAEQITKFQLTFLGAFKIKAQVNHHKPIKTSFHNIKT